MIQKREKEKPLPLKIEGQGSLCAEGTFLLFHHTEYLFFFMKYISKMITNCYLIQWSHSFLFPTTNYCNWNNI